MGFMTPDAMNGVIGCSGPRNRSRALHQKGAMGEAEGVQGEEQVGEVKEEEGREEETRQGADRAEEKERQQKIWTMFSPDRVDRGRRTLAKGSFPRWDAECEGTASPKSRRQGG